MLHFSVIELQSIISWNLASRPQLQQQLCYPMTMMRRKRAHAQTHLCIALFFPLGVIVIITMLFLFARRSLSFDPTAIAPSLKP